MLNNFLITFFGFNKQQRKGLLLLSIISLLLLLVRMVYPYFIVNDNIVVKDLQLVEEKIDSAFQSSKKYYSGFNSTSNSNLNLFVFNPNTVSFTQLIELGFKEKTAQTFIKFRSNGFVFTQKSDLQKVYGVSDKFYLQLEPYILIEKTITTPSGADDLQHKKNSAEMDTKKAKVKIELNLADSMGLIELKGIGSAFAKRILKYRTILGGFINVEQLKEVYGFTDELYEQILPFIKVDANLITKININKDDFKIINKHPYLSYELTKIICEWRRKTLITATNLKEIINDYSVYNKVLPYTDFR